MSISRNLKCEGESCAKILGHEHSGRQPGIEVLVQGPTQRGWSKVESQCGQGKGMWSRVLRVGTGEAHRAGEMGVGAPASQDCIL